MEARTTNEDHFWRYRQWGIKRGLTDKTMHSNLTIIKQAFKHGARQRLIPENPFSHISLSEPASRAQFCPDAEQVARVIDAAEPADRPLFAFLAYTGCRIGEARDLEWEDVVMNPDGTGHLLIHRGGSNGSTKTGKARRVPISVELRPHLEALPKKGKLVFTRSPSVFDPKGEGRLNDRKALNRLQKAAKVLNLPKGKVFKLHSLRHFFCSTLAASGAPERYVRGLLGHSSSTITDMYFSMFDTAAKETVDRIKLPKIPPAKPCEGDGAAES